MPYLYDKKIPYNTDVHYERERLAPNDNTGPFIQFEEETEGDYKVIQNDNYI